MFLIMRIQATFLIKLYSKATFLNELTGALAVDQSCLYGSFFFMQLAGQVD